MMMVVVTCATPLFPSNRLFFVRQKSVTMRLIVLPSCVGDWICLPSTEDKLENHQLAIQWHCEDQNLELFFKDKKQNYSKQNQTKSNKQQQQIEKSKPTDQPTKQNHSKLKLRLRQLGIIFKQHIFYREWRGR